MMQMAKRLGLFIGIFLAVLISLTALWSAVVPAVTRLVAACAAPVFRLVEAENVTHVFAQGDQLWVYRAVSSHQIAPFTWFDRYTFFAVVPLIALLVATPGLRIVGRLWRLAAGCAVLLAAHVVLLVLQVELAYAAVGLSRVWMLGTWQVVVRIAWEAAPIVVWVALTARVWKRWLGNVWKRQQARTGARGPMHASLAESEEG